MGALVAILQDSPGLLPCHVERLRDEVTLPATPGPAGWGFGWFGPSDVLLGRRPIAASPPPPLPDLVGAVGGEALLVHAGKPHGVTPRDENTQPFRHGRWLFATAGGVEGWPTIQPHVRDALPDHLRRAIHGETGAEHLFMLFLDELRGEVGLDDPELDAGAAARALTRTVRRLDGLAREAGLVTPSRLTLATTNGRMLGAVRRGGPLWYGLLEGALPCTLHGLDGRPHETDPRVAVHRRARAVVVATHPTSTARFIEVPQASALAVSRDLAVAVAPLEGA
jgi:predicted glutamine amidotransferase